MVFVDQHVLLPHLSHEIRTGVAVPHRSWSSVCAPLTVEVLDDLACPLMADLDEILTEIAAFPVDDGRCETLLHLLGQVFVSEPVTVEFKTPPGAG